jgi:hypothetical protein
MTNLHSGLACATNVTAGPTPSADAKQIILKEISAKWCKFSEHDLWSLKNANDLVIQVTSIAQRVVDALMKGRLTEPRISPLGRRNAASGNHPKMPDRASHD